MNALAVLCVALTVTVGGKVRTFTSVAVEDIPRFGVSAGDFLLTRGDLKLKVEGSVGENISFFTRTDVMWFDRTPVFKLSDLEGESWDNIIPFRVVPYTAYFVSSFGPVDFSAGKREVKWGFADVSPWGVFSPPDLANFVAFDPDYAGKGVPIPFANLTLNLPFDSDSFSDVSLDLTYVFSFKPSPLPTGFSSFFQRELSGRAHAVFSDILARFVEGFPGLVTNFGLPATYPYRTALEVFAEHSVSVPGGRPERSPFGVRASATVFGVDVFLGWARTYFPFPVLRRASFRGGLNWTLSAGEPAQIRSEGKADFEFFYPRLDVVGGGISFEILGFGVRGDVAYFIPEDVSVESVVSVAVKGVAFPESPSPAVIEDSVLSSSRAKLFENYIKAGVGIDRTFSVGLPFVESFYLNLQYSRGFFDEIGFTDEARGFLNLRKNTFITEVQDYLLGQFEFELARGDVKLGLTGILNVAQWKDFVWSALLMPSLTLKGDGFEFVTTYIRAIGEDDAKFGVFKGYSILTLNLAVIF